MVSAFIVGNLLFLGIVALIVFNYVFEWHLGLRWWRFRAKWFWAPVVIALMYPNHSQYLVRASYRRGVVTYKGAHVLATEGDMYLTRLGFTNYHLVVAYYEGYKSIKLLDFPTRIVVSEVPSDDEPYIHLEN